MKFVEPSANIIYNINDTIGIKLLTSTVWKVSVFQVFSRPYFSKIWTENGAGKLGIRTLFTQCGNTNSDTISKTNWTHFALVVLKENLLLLEASLQMCSYRKVFWNYAENLRDTNAEVDFSKFAIKLFLISINHTSALMFSSCKFAGYFQNTFS